MGKCLSRWCDDETNDDLDTEPVQNGHTIGEAQPLRKEAVELAVATGATQNLQPPAIGTPNTPRSVHVTMFTSPTVDSTSGSGKAGGSSSFVYVEMQDRCEELFNRYCDDTEDCILAEGVERLCADLGVEPEDFGILVLAWRCNVTAMCRFTHNEFVDGCCNLGVDSLSTLVEKLPSIAHDAAADRATFRKLYQWSYRFALDSAAGQRTLPVDIAVAMWRVVFSVPAGSSGIARSAGWVVPLWLQFVEHDSCVRGITRDTWDMFLNFVESLGDGTNGMAGYDDTEAWPSLFDDFVTWAHTRPRPIPTAWPEVTEPPAIEHLSA